MPRRPTCCVWLCFIANAGARQTTFRPWGVRWNGPDRAFRYSPSSELMLVLGRISELQGDNPKTILNSLYATLMEEAPTYAPGFLAAGDLACRKWDYQLAAEYYEKALKLQKDNQDALAGLAECYWKSSDPRLEECLERLLALNPHHFREAAEFERRALESDPDDYLARAYYAFDLLRLGDAVEGRRQLEQAFKADRYNVTVFNMLNLLDSLQRFETVERGPFVLQLPRKEAPILANDALALLQEAYASYTRKYEVELEKPIRVQMFDHHDDSMVRSVGLPGSVGHLGICFGQLVTMDSPSARSKGEANWKSVLWHEFVHVITLQKTKNRVPRWLSESISVYEETQRDPAWGQRLNVQYKAIVEHDNLPSTPALKNSKPGLFDRGATTTLAQAEGSARSSPFTDVIGPRSASIRGLEQSGSGA